MYDNIEKNNNFKCIVNSPEGSYAKDLWILIFSSLKSILGVKIQDDNIYICLCILYFSIVF